MDIIRGLHNLRSRHRGCVATIGNFDGVHRGHQALLADLAAEGARLGLPSCLITFEPQPREFFQGAAVPARLTRFREKALLLARHGLDRLLCLPFNERLAALPAEAVVADILVAGLGVRHLVVGDDFRFGADRGGDRALLARAGARHGFTLGAVPTVRSGGEQGPRISSTLVRTTLADGHIDAAAELLGHRYFIMGRVVYGRQLGRQLGVPTVNIPLQRYQAALNGVYVVEAQIHGTGGGLVPAPGSCLVGVANIGVRPTVAGREPLLEVHLLDVSADLYGRLVTVTFRHKLREEQTFDGLPALQSQLGRDINQARAWLQANGVSSAGNSALSASAGNHRAAATPVPGSAG